MNRTKGRTLQWLFDPKGKTKPEESELQLIKPSTMNFITPNMNGLIFNSVVICPEAVVLQR